jgi:hypothetical protein
MAGVFAGSLAAVGVGCSQRFWWYPATCDDPVLRADAPTPSAVWVGGMDGRYVECARGDIETCPMRCRTFTYDGRTNSAGCAVCAPASACESIDLSRCGSYDGFDDGKLCFTNGACLSPVPASGLEL